MQNAEQKKYAAKLLFQYRVVVAGESNKRRTCEEKIVLINAASASDALKKAKSIGVAGELDYPNSDGNPVYYEFVGVVDLLHLGAECDENEVWYEIKEYLTPMERSTKLLPPEDKLCAIRIEAGK